MSHAATNWAIQQRGLKPATKIVMWFLCDRHNPDFGCFTTQARLAEKVEMSIAALNEHLATLEELGLIHRIRAYDPHNPLKPLFEHPRAHFRHTRNHLLAGEHQAGVNWGATPPSVSAIDDPTVGDDCLPGYVVGIRSREV
jgi:hypothetical protein